VVEPRKRERRKEAGWAKRGGGWLRGERKGRKKGREGRGVMGLECGGGGGSRREGERSGGGGGGKITFACPIAGRHRKKKLKLGETVKRRLL